jgi:hypothetical protein
MSTLYIVSKSYWGKSPTFEFSIYTPTLICIFHSSDSFILNNSDFPKDFIKSCTLSYVWVSLSLVHLFLGSFLSLWLCSLFKCNSMKLWSTGLSVHDEQYFN